MKTPLLCLSLFATAAANAADHSPRLLWQLHGFDAPESVIAIPGTNQYLVSNIGGHPGEKDGNGFISLISASGEWLEKRWADGMDAPKGMAISDDKLFVSDLDHLWVLDLSDGKVLDRASHPDARFLNDVAASPAGDIYISDMLAGTVFRYRDGDLSLWHDLPDIPHPNGLHFHDDRLYVASWGKDMQADFSTTEKGGVYTIDVRSKLLTPLAEAQEFANLDAIEFTEAGMLTNDWLTGDVYRLDASGPRVWFNAGVSAADFGWDARRVLVPVMFENRVDVYTLR